MAKIKKLVFSIALIFFGMFVTYVFADLQIRRDIMDSVAFIKRIMFTNNGMANGTATVVIDGGSGNITISGDINVGSGICIGGVCRKDLQSDSMWKFSGAQDISYNTGNVNVGKALVVSGTLSYKGKNSGTELVLNGSPSTYSCPSVAVACVTYCLDSATSKIKGMKWLQAGGNYPECSTEGGDVLHVVVHYR